MKRSGTFVSPHRQKMNEAEEVFDLLCAARNEIKLSDRVYDCENRSAYIDLMQLWCAEGAVWEIREGLSLQAALVLRPHSSGGHEILYVVAASDDRRRGMGSMLVRHIQARRFVHKLRGEARNDKSKSMLEKCGFVWNGETDNGCPILQWPRSLSLPNNEPY